MGQSSLLFSIVKDIRLEGCVGLKLKLLGTMVDRYALGFRLQNHHYLGPSVESFLASLLRVPSAFG